MVKKKFIDKKQSTTYSLVFRSTEDADDLPERVLVEADQSAGAGRADAGGTSSAADEEASGRRYPPGHPLSWLEEEERGAPMSEARRRELIELGFPDDGYDYLKHMRVLGHGTASLEGMPAEAASSDAAAGEPAAAGPSIFVPAAEVQAPEEDMRVIDASRLTVMQAVEVEQDAAVMAGGVTAFSRERERECVRGTLHRELAELEAAMEELEGDEELGHAEGAGDLLDDFVLAATDQGPAAASHGEHSSEQGDEYSVLDSEEEEEGQEEDYTGSSTASSGDPGVGGSHAGSLAARSSKPPPRPGSIASTYWREERTDRKNLLTVIDERFEHLALEYDDEEIGDLEEQGDTIRGFADVKEFDGLLDEFLEAHGQSQEAHEGNVPYAAPRVSQVRAEMEAYGFDDSDAAVAVQKAHEALRRAEAEEAAREAQEADSEPRAERDPIPAYYLAQERERWDCESVLSLRSNLDNHPGSISEPISSHRRQGSSDTSASGAGGLIRLDRRGIPRSYMPRRGLGAVPEAAEGHQSDEEAGGVQTATSAAIPMERRKGETAEEKKARKAAVKDSQRHARAQKRELRAAFKQAEKQAARLAATAQPQAAVKLPS